MTPTPKAVSAEERVKLIVAQLWPGLEKCDYTDGDLRFIAEQIRLAQEEAFKAGIDSTQDTYFGVKLKEAYQKGFAEAVKRAAEIVERYRLSCNYEVGHGFMGILQAIYDEIKALRPGEEK